MTQVHVDDHITGVVVAWCRIYALLGVSVRIEYDYDNDADEERVQYPSDTCNSWPDRSNSTELTHVHRETHTFSFNRTHTSVHTNVRVYSHNGMTWNLVTQLLKNVCHLQFTRIQVAAKEFLLSFLVLCWCHSHCLPLLLLLQLLLLPSSLTSPSKNKMNKNSREKTHHERGKNLKNENEPRNEGKQLKNFIITIERTYFH